MKAAELFVTCLENAELQQNYPALRLRQWRRKFGGLSESNESAGSDRRGTGAQFRGCIYLLIFTLQRGWRHS